MRHADFVKDNGYSISERIKFAGHSNTDIFFIIESIEGREQPRLKLLLSASPTNFVGTIVSIISSFGESTDSLTRSKEIS